MLQFRRSWYIDERAKHNGQGVINGLNCRSGGIGRRKGLKIPRAHKARAGSIPASGTNIEEDV